MERQQPAPPRALVGILTPVGLALALDAGIFLFGEPSDSRAPAGIAVSVPPGWFVGAVWVTLFALLGAARWRLLKRGSLEGRRGARWVTFFLVVCALYPLYTAGLRSQWVGLGGNILTCGLGAWIGWQLNRVDRLSAAVLLLVAGWLCFASFTIIEQLGWLAQA